MNNRSFINLFFFIDSREITSARKSLLVQNFKCYYEDEFSNNFFESSEYEEPIYACKFGDGQHYGHILAIADEVGTIGLRDTRAADNTAPVKGIAGHFCCSLLLALIANVDHECALVALASYHHHRHPLPLISTLLTKMV